MDIQKIIQDNSRFLALTTLTLTEFEELLSPFSESWYQYIKHYTLRGQRRPKPLTARQIVSSTTKLSTDEERLFFILYFFKNSHLQQSLSAQFDMNQSQISRWIHALLPVLERSIIRLHLQAARTMDELVRLFRTRQRADSQSQNAEAKSLHLDVTERKMERNHDVKAQEYDYSGKQGYHTLKNSVLSDEGQFIHFAGYTYRGAIHDKAMAEEELPDLSALIDWELWFSKDKAYQGYQPPGVHLLEPFKAARNRPLNDMQKSFNSWISSIRITCEHAIGGVKRCRILKETLRYFDATFRDKIFFVACGLHNFRVTRRIDNYSNGAARTRAHMNLNF